MLEGLFNEEATEYEASKSLANSKSARLPRPSQPRNNTGLCGLSNLGATCYLNSLLQTLHYTPEFREELFRLPEDELGVFSSVEGADNSMVRVIPIQLQKLFANLLLLNQQSCSVDALTNSFGWNSSEELQQHDVQELNRILFSAIESSLLGTSGEHLIAKLYHGISVQQIACQSCGRVSEKEEEYLDLAVALSARPNLESVLKDTFIEQELLEGANQYYCCSCQRLVDAKRGCHIRKLPPILTFALLRFLYDFERGERYKDTSKFKFPLEIDMTPYSEPDLVKGGTIYELFSVVIHSGSTHSGHYTAYIKDVDCLGCWTHPGENKVQLQSDPSSGCVDLIDFENPADLLQELVKQLGGVVSLAKLCKALQERTGVTWNKRFKKQFGPIGKFLKSCHSMFSVSELNQVSLSSQTWTSGDATTSQNSSVLADHPDSAQPSSLVTAAEKEPMVVASVEQSVSSTQPGSVNLSNDLDDSLFEDMEAESKESDRVSDLFSFDNLDVSTAREGSGESSGTVLEVSPGHGGGVVTVKAEEDGAYDANSTSSHQCSDQTWFEFNDTNVSPILINDIDKMFQGRQSAYMLFYRRKSMPRPVGAQGNRLYGVPEQFQVEVATANAQLDEERFQYDVAINTVEVNLNFSLEFVFSQGALQRIEDSEPCVLTMDRRSTVADLKANINGAFSVMCCPDMVIHIARSVPAGLHLYDCISGENGTCLADAGITNQCQLFVWDGVSVGGEAIGVGKSCEPVSLQVTYPTGSGEFEMSAGFPKNSTLGHLRDTLSHLLDIQSNLVTVSQLKISERNGKTSVVVLSSSKDSCTLEELRLTDGDRLTIERNVKKGVMSLAHYVADKHSKMLSLIIENRLQPLPEQCTSYPVFALEVGKDELVSTLKSTAQAFNVDTFEGDCRLRIDDDSSGHGPPLHEEQTVSEAGITPGQRLIIEPGPAPLNNQVALQGCVMSPGVSSVSVEVCEIVLDKKATVRECKDIMVVTSGLTGGDWHLRKTNWCGEAAEILEDEDSTLEQERIKSGDLLLIEEGRLPPKGFICLKVFLYIPSSQSSKYLSQASCDLKAETQANKTLSSEPTLQDLQECYPPVLGELIEVGNLEISKEATVADLKMIILTLPAMEDAGVLVPTFIRVRELVNARPGKIFKVDTQTMGRLKLTSGSKVCCTVLPREEELSTTSLVVNICLRIPCEKCYGEHTEIILDTTQSSSPYALRAHVSQLVDIPVERLSLAKHKMETFDWIRIQDSYQTDSKRRGRKKGHNTKVNIKNSPIMLKDGDTVGIKDLQYDPDDLDDFSTPLDHKGKSIMAALQEDKRKRRKIKGNTDLLSEGHTSKGGRQRRQEVGIKIFVPDYQTNLRQKQL